MTLRRQLLNFGSRSCDFRVGVDALAELSVCARAAVGQPRRAHVLVGAQVGDEMLRDIVRSLIDAGFEADTTDVPDGAPGTMDTVLRVLDVLDGHGITVDDLLVGVGDASVASVTSVAAKLWDGGVQSLIIPTTLDAMVSAATAMRPLDTSRSQGMVMFRPEPTMVVCDVSLVAGAPQEELEEGLVLIMGTYLADSRRSWDKLGEMIPKLASRQRPALAEVLAQAQTARRGVLMSANPSSRHALAYGVATARALRSCLGPDVPWARLLAEGMRFEARLGVEVVGLSTDDLFEQDDRFDDLGIEELAFDIPAERFVEALRAEAARHGNRLLFALPKVPGRIRLTHVPDEVLERHAAAYVASRSELLAEDEAEPELAATGE